jgi:hypothetical protein
MGHGTDGFTSPPKQGMLWIERPLLVKDRIMGEKWRVNLACYSDSHVNRKVLLHAANLRHGTDGFTSPPKEGMLWIFFARKIRRLRLVSNPRSWVPEASMLTTRPPKSLCHTHSSALRCYRSCSLCNSTFPTLKYKSCVCSRLHITHHLYHCTSAGNQTNVSVLLNAVLELLETAFGFRIQLTNHILSVSRKLKLTYSTKHIPS